MANRQRAMEGLELKVWQTDREQWKVWSLRYGKQTESNRRGGADSEGMANRHAESYGRPGAEGMANRQRATEGLELKYGSP